MLHGAGIFTYKTGWFLGHMLVNIPYMEHMGCPMSPVKKSPDFIVTDLGSTSVKSKKTQGQKKIPASILQLADALINYIIHIKYIYI